MYSLCALNHHILAVDTQTEDGGGKWKIVQYSGRPDDNNAWLQIIPNCRHLRRWQQGSFVILQWELEFKTLALSYLLVLYLYLYLYSFLYFPCTKNLVLKPILNPRCSNQCETLLHALVDLAHKLRPKEANKKQTSSLERGKIKDFKSLYHHTCSQYSGWQIQGQAKMQ